MLLKKQTILCPYCGAKAILRPACDVYGVSERSVGRHLYVCSNWPVCDAYVSAHVRNKKPMGRLADGNLRHKRILAHRALKNYQTVTHMEKWAVYVWLQGKLGQGEHQIHIANFSETMDQVIAICEEATAAYRASRRVG